MPKKYSRPGVEAAVRLSKCVDRDIWETIEAKYKDMLEIKGGKALVKLNEECNSMRRRTTEGALQSKEGLMTIVQWKFKKGKPRNALLGYLRSNSDEHVKKCVRRGMESADKDNVKEAIQEVTQLSGVGPATASAILSIYKPDLFAFMDDEVIEALHDGKRVYTLAVYLELNDKCSQIARKLGGDWTPRKVGRALWTAARVLATDGDDLTRRAEQERNKENPTNSRQTKRRKKN